MRLAVEIEGDGEPVVMIHGLGGTTNTFTPLLPAFARHKRVRFDLPGSGRSRRVEGPLSLRAVRRGDAAGAWPRPRCEKAHVVAHSMGTIVAAHLAAAEPDAVESLALFGPLLAPPEQARAAIRARAAKARGGTCSRSPTPWSKPRLRAKPKRSDPRPSPSCASR